MRLVTFAGSDQRERVGVVSGDSLVDVTRVAPTMLELIRGGPSLLATVRDEVAKAVVSTALDEVTLLPPIPRPPKNVICVGMNYAKHVAEGAAATTGTLSADLPTLPVWFTKAGTSLCGPFEDIVLDATVSRSIDWEVELVVVIGKEGRSIRQAAAGQHVHSYTVLNDVSARDIQMRHGGQFFKGKSLDRSSPMGPWLVTAEEIPDPQQLRLSCSVNGIEMQRGETADMIFSVASLISDISEVLTLEPGDLIATGTPSGVGLGRTPPIYLKPGDLLESQIEGVGTLRNRILEVPEAFQAGADRDHDPSLEKEFRS